MVTPSAPCLALAAILALNGCGPPPTQEPSTPDQATDTPAPAASAALSAAPASSAAIKPGSRRLTVALYPYVPRYKEMKEEVVRRFKEAVPQGPELELIDLDNYYKPDKEGSVVKTQAQVVEIDSVFLADMLPKLAALPPELKLNPNDFHPAAVTVATDGGAVWRVAPHWLCSNFLFATKDITLKVSSFAGLQKTARVSLPKRGVLVDLMGSSTLGELFFDAQFDEYGDIGKVVPAEGAPLGSTPGMKALVALSKTCASGFCRSEEYHDDSPVYGRLMARQEGIALVAYSEVLNAFIDEARKKCGGKPCLDENALEVLPFAFSDKGDKPFVWVDSFGINKETCKDACVTDASAFIAFMLSDEELKKTLLPPGVAPPYLMPAKQTVNAALDEAAPYYKKIRPIVARAAPVLSPGLGAKLRELGGLADAELGKHNKGAIPR